MTELSAPFAPDWVSPPGDSIADAIDERSWTQAELAARLGFSEKFVSQLLNGKVALTQETAEKLEKVIGGSIEFWMDREANYQRHKARLEAAKRHCSWVSWLIELPIKELMSCNAIPKVRVDEKNKPGIVEACLKFFGVASPDQWRDHYCGMQVSFRRSKEEQSDVGAISAWLRLGEQEAEKISAPKFDKARFEKALNRIRDLTREQPEVFEPKLRRELNEAGVLLIFVPSIPRSHVSGVARWLGPSRPVIQMSLYGKTNDKFWFTFAHEAAHILLHGNDAEGRKSIFLDDPNATKSTDPKEHEANLWASRWLIPQIHEARLSSLRTKVAVRAYAEEIGIHPGIVVGRLQHEKRIEPSWFNDLKVSFQLSKA
ncbi:MAG: helix-turn-helix domain-containing protein [Pseudomonas sp.]|uniref:helix-turn-helix domain-containing protein n=1 Tax=Pseudomonas sp. TaxID=306 RepID=UPI001E102A0C|nr:helix-turn-helix domain-containing protein [Pseudomonas sp.]MPS98575.1 helix-turn-helix domain-containing protein [Pseudomonas sp.]